MSGVRKHFWQRRQAVVRRLLSTLEVGLERVHARRGEQYRRIVLGGNERPGRQPLVVATFEEAEEALADLVGGHRDLSLGCTPMRVVSTRVVYENRWMRLREDRPERDDGTPGLYGFIEMAPAALVVPIEDGHVWLIEQYRHPLGERFWEFPQGAVGGRRRARRGPCARRARGRDRPARRADGSPRPPVLHARAQPPAGRHLACDRARTRRAGARGHRAGPDRRAASRSTRSTGWCARTRSATRPPSPRGTSLRGTSVSCSPLTIPIRGASADSASTFADLC